MRKILKIFFYVIGGILALLLIVIVLLNTPFGKEQVRSRAEAYLRKKLKTEVRIGKLGYGLPKYIVLEDVLLKDEAKDTLLSFNKFEIDIDMLKLLHKQVDVKEIDLEGVHAYVYRNMPDTNFNFSYIINAFTGGAAKTKTTDTASKKSQPLAIDVNRVRIDDVHIRYEDQTGGMNLAVDLEHLLLKMKKIDLVKMQFHIKTLEVAGLQTAFAQDTSYIPTKHDTTQARLGLIADNVDMQRIAFNYNDHLGKLLFDIGLGKLQVKLNNFDLVSHAVDLDKFILDTSSIKIVMGKKNNPLQAAADTVVKIDTTEGWHVNAGNINIAAVNFKMDNQNVARQPSGIDYQHLDLQHFTLKAQDLLYTSDTISGNLQHVALQEQSGLDLRELRTKFNYNPKGAYLRDLYLQTSNTILQNYAAVSYPSLEILKKDIGRMKLKIDLEKSVVGMQDVLLFAPQLGKQPLIHKYCKGHWQLTAGLEGYVNAIDIKQLKINGIGATEVALNGRLNGMPDINKLNYNIDIEKLKSSREEMEALLPKAALANVRLPERFGIAGHVSGTAKDYDARLLLASTAGNAYLEGNIMTSPGKGNERYNVYLKTQNLQLGSILKQDSLLGAVTADIKVSGRSFDIHRMKARVSGDVSAAEIKGYVYHGLSLKGKITDQVGDIHLNSADTNLHVQVDAHADLHNKYAAIKAKINIDRADLQALKLYKSQLKLAGVIEADIPVLNPDYPRGSVVWQQPVIVANGQRYAMDSLYVLSKSGADSGLDITANLDVLQARITGKTPLTKIGSIIEDHLNRHYQFAMNDSAKRDTAIVAKTRKPDTSVQLPADYNLNLTARIVDAPILHSVLPGLTEMDSIHIDADMTPRYLKADASIPNVTYGSTIVQNGVVNISGTDSAFTYKVTADRIAQSKFQFWYTNIHGNLDKDLITTNISIADSAKKERFALAASLTKSGDTQIVQLRPGLKLNYQPWEVAVPNKIVFSKAGMYIQNFRISNAGQYIKANSVEASAGAPLKIDVNNFLLANITQIFSRDTLLANGLLGGDITITKFSPAMELNGTMQVQNLSVLNDTVGNLKVAVNNTDGNRFDTKLNINGNGNDIAMNGAYYLNAVNGNNYDMTLDMKALNLASVQDLSMNQIKNGSGYLRGELQIKGPTTGPVITGTLNTDQLAMTVSMLGAYFKMPADKIVFNNNEIAFNDFEILDNTGNKAVLNGSVDIKSLSNMRLDMHVRANNWRVLHSTEKDNKLFYGDLLLSANLNIKGTPQTPDVDGNLNILKNTKMTVVMPESNPELQSTKGIVEFVDMRDTGRYVLKPSKPKKDTMKVVLSKGSDINVNINVNKDAEFTVIIDQASGDFLRVKGDANLNASVNPGGGVALSGNYELTEGAYQLNYNFIKRKFAIQKGSSIIFAGDPLHAQADITAVYEADVPPYDLIQKEVPDQAQLNYYKQRLPFDVELHLKGHILKPAISFNVTLPDNKVYPLSTDQIELIQGKLGQIRTDTSELNKQVFALLILNRFVSDDPFTSGAGSSVSSTAMQSVSTFIGEQLNQLTNKLVKGVDVNVDLASTDDYTTGTLQQRTDLNVEASKRLLNDRLKLTVGNDFELEGPQTNNNTQNNLLPTNLAADYLLTADGRYIMRAYRKNYDEGVLQGYVTETGLNFIVSLDYNHFRNIFRKKPHKKEQTTEAAH